MGRIDKVFAFLAVCISTALLFQNCGGPSATKKSGSINVNGESVNPNLDFGDNLPDPEDVDPIVPEEEDPVVPATLSNRNFVLNNKVKVGEVNYTTGVGDVLIYETNYLATSKSTVVQVMDSATFVKMTVDSDQCTGEMELDGNEVTVLAQGIFDAYVNTTEKTLVGAETVTAGCGFPRVLLNASALAAGGIVNRGDLDIYLSARECVPEGELFLNSTTAGQNEMIRNAVNAHMKALIDEVCGL